jgi:N-acylglucosamine 2-epimerase
MKHLKSFADLYFNEALNRLIPFWLTHSIDTEFGGYFNFITDSGQTIDTDKSIKWHGQQVSTFIEVCKYIETRSQWLDYAQHGVDFLLAFAQENYGIVDRTGRLLTKSTDYASDAWVATALADFGTFTGDERCSEKATKLLLKILKQRQKNHQKALENINGERLTKNISEIITLTRAVLACKDILSKKVFEEQAQALLYELNSHFWEPRAEILLENSYISGGYYESSEGRRINAGLVFEAVNVFTVLARAVKDRKTSLKLAQLAIYLSESAWDELYGGFYYCLDFKSYPLPDPTAQFKYDWVQFEALMALQTAQKTNPQADITRHWQRIHDYIWTNFSPRKIGTEWHGTLNRQGEPVVSLVATPTRSAFTIIPKLLIINNYLQSL